MIVNSHCRIMLVRSWEKSPHEWIACDGGNGRQRVSVLSDNHREWYQQRWGLRGLIVRLLLLLLQQYVGVVV
jgi:hypothetical protein